MSGNISSPPNKQEKSALLTVGVRVPMATTAAGESDGCSSFGMDIGDIGSFSVQCRCPWCDTRFRVTEETDEQVTCEGCKRDLRIEIDDICVTFEVMVQPVITETDRKYLAERGLT